MANPINKNATDQLSRDQLVKQQVNKYIRNVVKRYLPKGTQYILVDEAMNVLDPGKEDV